jgi:acetylornithine deacetylase/succinyl-diaminopimelate desuccinylase-like protein
MNEIAIRKECNELENIVQQCSLAALADYGQFQKTFAMAAGIRQLKNLITDEMMKDIMPLQGSSLGFRTDKDSSGGYPLPVVRECLIEAVLRGLQPVGNQFNIISGRCYTTKEGFTHLLKTLQGLSDLKLTFGVPQMQQGGATVEGSASWKFNGNPDSITRQFAIRLNSGMGADGAIGKAERKLRAAVYAQITGTVLSDGEADQEPINVTPPKPQSEQGKVSSLNDEV